MGQFYLDLPPAPPRRIQVYLDRPSAVRVRRARVFAITACVILAVLLLVFAPAGAP